MLEHQLWEHRHAKEQISQLRKILSDTILRTRKRYGGIGRSLVMAGVDLRFLHACRSGLSALSSLVPFALLFGCFPTWSEEASSAGVLAGACDCQKSFVSCSESLPNRATCGQCSPSFTAQEPLQMGMKRVFTSGDYSSLRRHWVVQIQFRHSHSRAQACN